GMVPAMNAHKSWRTTAPRARGDGPTEYTPGNVTTDRPVRGAGQGRAGSLAGAEERKASPPSGDRGSPVPPAGPFTAPSGAASPGAGDGDGRAQAVAGLVEHVLGAAVGAVGG